MAGAAILKVFDAWVGDPHSLPAGERDQKEGIVRSSIKLL
jgi:hypothetical protein